MNKKMGAVCCIAFLFALYGMQCTVVTRRYTKGFYVSSVKKNQGTKQSGIERKVFPRTEDRKDISFFVQKSHVQAQEKVLPLELTASVKEMPRRLDFPKNLQLPPDSCGDRITFMSGEELEVKVEEIAPDYLAYRRCDYLTGPLIKTATANIFRVKFTNGTVRVFKHDNPAPAYSDAAGNSHNRSPVEKRTNGWAVASFVTSLFSLLVLPAVLGLIFGIVSLKQFENEPEKHKGKWMAVVGTTISSIAIALFLLILLVNI